MYWLHCYITVDFHCLYKQERAKIKNIVMQEVLVQLSICKKICNMNFVLVKNIVNLRYTEVLTVFTPLAIGTDCRLAHHLLVGALGVAVNSTETGLSTMAMLPAREAHTIIPVVSVSAIGESGVTRPILSVAIPWDLKQS